MPPTLTPSIRTPAGVLGGEPAKTRPSTEPVTASSRNASAPRWTRTRVEVFFLRRARAGTARESVATRAGSVPRKEDFPGNHEALDLGRSLVDLEELRVAHQLLDGVLLHVPVAAEDLDRVGRDLHRGVGCEPLRVRRLERRSLALVEEPRGLPGEQARSLDLGGHVRNQEVDALVHRDRLAELDSLAGVVDRELVRGARDP